MGIHLALVAFAGPGFFVTERVGTAYWQIKKTLSYEMFEMSMIMTKIKVILERSLVLVPVSRGIRSPLKVVRGIN